MSVSNKNKLLALSLTTAISLATTSAIAAPEEAFTFGSNIVDAAETGDVAVVQNLIAAGVSPNESGEFGATPLMRAAYNNNVAMVKLLIANGADVNAKDIGGATALSIASREGHDNIIKLLVVAGADVNTADAEGVTPLMRAKFKGNDNASQILKDVGAGKPNAKPMQVAAPKIQVEREADIILDMSGGRLSNESQVAMNELSESYKERQAQRMQMASAIAPMKKVPMEEADFSFGSVNIPVKPEFFDEPQVVAKKQTTVTAAVKPSTNKFYPAAKEESSASIAAQNKQTREWLAKLEKIMAEDQGSYELSATDMMYKQGEQYNVLDLGNFKGQAFADKKIEELKKNFPDVFADLPLKAIQKNINGAPTYQVNAGIINDKAKAGEICKKLILAGVNCRPVETRLMSQDEFNQYKGEAPKPVEVAKAEPAPAPTTAAPKQPERQDLLGAAPAPQVSSKPIDAPAPAPAPVPAAPKPVEIAKAEPAKPALPPLTPAPTPAPAAKAPEAPKPAPAPVAAAPKPSDNIASISALQEPTEDDSSIFDIFDSEPKVVKTPEVVVAPAPAPIAAPAPKPVAAKVPEAPKPTPAPKPVEVAAAPAPTPAPAALPKAEDESTFKELKQMISEKPKAEDKLEIVEKKDIQTITAKEGEVVSQTSKTEITKTTVPTPPAPAPVVMAAAPKPVPAPAPEPVKIDNKLDLPTLPGAEEKAEAPKPVEPEIQAPKAPEKKMEIEVSDAKPEPAPKPEPKHEAPKPAAAKPAPSMAPAPAPKDLASPAAAPAKFEVARPVKVTDARPPIAPSVIDEPTPMASTPVVSYTPSSNLKPIGQSREFWARIDHFDNSDSARAYWNSLQAANPSLMGLRFRSTTPLNNINKVSAEIGPFADAAEARNLCSSLSAQGMACSLESNIPVKYGTTIPSTGTVGGRHSQKGQPIRRNGSFDYNQRHSFNSSSSMYQSAPTSYPRHSDGQQEVLAFGEQPKSGYTLQFGSFASYDEAQARWKAISGKNRDLKKLSSDIVMENGSYRLRAGSFASTDAADSLCDKLRGKAVSCIIVRA